MSKCPFLRGGRKEAEIWQWHSDSAASADSSCRSSSSAVSHHDGGDGAANSYSPSVFDKMHGPNGLFPLPQRRAGPPAASISLSAFGGGGQHGSPWWLNPASRRREPHSQSSSHQQSLRGRHVATDVLNEPKLASTDASASAHVSSSSSSAASEGAKMSTGMFKPDSKCPVARIQRVFFGPPKLRPVSSLSSKASFVKQMKCPAIVVNLRKSIAALPCIQKVRRKILPLRVLFVAMISFLVNIPLGHFRENFEKFSPGWLLTAHSSIPIVATFRKAVVLPIPTILATICFAVLGQAIGARLSAKRKKDPSQNNHNPSLTPATVQ